MHFVMSDPQERLDAGDYSQAEFLFQGFHVEELLEVEDEFELDLIEF